MTQSKELIIRNFRAQWRGKWMLPHVRKHTLTIPTIDGSFWTTQLAILIFFGLFVGFYWFKIDHSPNNMSAASLGILVAIQGLPGIAMDIGINYLAKLDMFLARERLGIYSWQALVTSLLIVSIPVLFVGWNILFFCFYWTIDLIGTRADGVLIWLCFLSCAILNGSFGVLLGAVSPNRLSLPYILSLVWNCEQAYHFPKGLELILFRSAQLSVLGLGLLLWSSFPIPLLFQCKSNMSPLMISSP